LTKRLVFAILHAVGATKVAAACHRKRVTIICYHGVSERASRSPHDPFGLHVRGERFIAHLDYLRRHYRVISLREYLAARREGRRLPDYSVILTFDDGYRNLFTAAAPRLTERLLPATVFLITDRVRKDGDGDYALRWAPTDDEIYLSWAEIGALAQGVNLDFGSHTCSHIWLTRAPFEEAERELRHSYDAMVSHGLGQEGVSLAYPYGAYSPSIVERARSLGYACALTTDEGTNDETTNLFALRRVLIGDDDEVAAFAARVSGLTRWLHRLTRLLGG
jgi:peptidoglycan/xylan/chitin deacetylase (PgdA/CDA1 family)